MAFEDTHCPCGDSKERETMLCAKCEECFAATTESAVLRRDDYALELKRSAAIRLLNLARKRKRQSALPLQFLH